MGVSYFGVEALDQGEGLSTNCDDSLFRRGIERAKYIHGRL